MKFNVTVTNINWRTSRHQGKYQLVYFQQQFLVFPGLKHSVIVNWIVNWSRYSGVDTLILIVLKLMSVRLIS